MNERVGIETGSGWSRNSLGVQTQFEMLFFPLLGLSESFALSAAWHVYGGGSSLLLFDALACLRGRERRGFSGIRMPAHSFVIPAMK
jgi:hypothetical protein